MQTQEELDKGCETFVEDMRKPWLVARRNQRIKFKPYWDSRLEALGRGGQ